MAAQAARFSSVVTGGGCPLNLAKAVVDGLTMPRPSATAPSICVLRCSVRGKMLSLASRWQTAFPIFQANTGVAAVVQKAILDSRFDIVCTICLTSNELDLPEPLRHGLHDSSPPEFLLIGCSSHFSWLAQI
jgi:hypothetical protein